MARINTFVLLRARLREWTHTPWALLLLFAGDLVELVASVGLALASPPPAAPKPPYAAVDLPTTPAQLTLGVAIMGVMVGVLMGAAIVAELWMMVRRAQILSWRYGTRREQRASVPRGARRPGLARGPAA